MTEVKPLLLTLICLLLSFTACGEKDDEDNEDPDGSADTDSDVDSDADADSDSDSDTDVVGCSSSGEGSFSVLTEEVTFTSTIDAVSHGATLFLPDGAGPFAAVVLLHMNCADRSEWDMTGGSMARELAAIGFAVLTYDLRGYGDSDNGPVSDLCANSSGNEAEFAKMDDDLADAVSFLDTRSEVDTSCLGVGGSSIGANVALVFAAADDTVNAALALSPGLDYMGVEPLPSMPDLSGRPSLMIAADGDTYSASSVNDLVAAAGPDAQGEIYSGTDHGMQILITHQEAFDLTLQWFADNL